MQEKSTYQELERKIKQLEDSLAKSRKRDLAFRQNEERYREIIEGTDNLITEVDCQGRFTFVNDAARQVFGLPSEDCLGKPAFDFVHPDDKEKTLRIFNEWIRTKTISATLENRQVSLTGESRDMLWSIKLHYDENGTVSSLRSIARDITDRKNSEKELRLSNDRFQRIFKSEAIGIVLANLNGKILEANNAFLQMTGYESGDLPLDWQEMTPPEWHQQDVELTSKIRNLGIVPASDKEYFRKDGSRIPATLVGVLVQEEDEKVLCFILDQTERKKAVDKLQQSEAKRSSIFKAAPIGIGVTNSDRIMQDVNNKLCHMTGYTSEELLGRNSRLLYANKDDYDFVGKEKYRQILQFGTGNIETVWQKKDGTTMNILLSSSPVTPGNIKAGTTFTALDITKWKQDEDALRKSEAFLSATFSSIQDGISVLDTDLTIMETNPTMERWYKDQMPLKGKKCYSCYHARSTPCENCPTVQALESGTTASGIVHSPQGSAVEWLELFSYPLYDTKTKKMTGVVEFVRNITERKQAEQDLIEKEEKYRNLVEIFPQAVSISQNKRIVFANSACASMFGTKSVDELIGKEIDRGLSDQDKERLMSYAHKREQNDSTVPSQYEAVFKREDGKTFIGEVTVSSTLYEGKPASHYIISDISKKKKEEEELLNYREKLEEIVKKRTRELSSTIDTLKRRNFESETISRLGDLLQACETDEESYSIISTLCSQVFPCHTGFLAVYDESTSLIRSVAEFGKLTDSNIEFETNQCWALRRGGIHTVASPDKDPVCPHIKERLQARSICVPIGVTSGTMGLLHLRWDQITEEDEEHCEGELEAITVLAKRVAELYALSLSNIRLRAKLRHQSIRDPLTGLFNRRYMEESLYREINRAKRKKGNIGLIMLDVDHFKKFNDDFGHEAGDEVLKRLGEFLNAFTRKEDIACRYGGEELLVILPDCPTDVVKLRSEEIRNGIESLFISHGQQQLSVTASLGAAVYPDNADAADLLISAADSALYRAKDMGRNRVVMAE